MAVAAASAAVMEATVSWVKVTQVVEVSGEEMGMEAATQVEEKEEEEKALAAVAVLVQASQADWEVMVVLRGKTGSEKEGGGRSSFHSLSRPERCT
mmetsp:Transcript_27820/g.71019  ORF Transcript_27820/g.71019 Transcript_27820/m.71019 type:complete len:96 (+) Transcript_27820:373-660(+)